MFGLILLTVFVSTAFAKVHYEEAVSHPSNFNKAFFVLRINHWILVTVCVGNPRVCVIPETGSYVQLGSSKQMGRDDSSKCERVTCQRNGYDRYDTVQYSLYGVRSYDPAYGLRIKYET